MFITESGFLGGVTNALPSNNNHVAYLSGWLITDSGSPCCTCRIVNGQKQQKLRWSVVNYMFIYHFNGAYPPNAMPKNRATRLHAKSMQRRDLKRHRAGRRDGRDGATRWTRWPRNSRHRAAKFASIVHSVGSELIWDVFRVHSVLYFCSHYGSTFLN